jgi:hypothetical protein
MPTYRYLQTTFHILRTKQGLKPTALKLDTVYEMSSSHSSGKALLQSIRFADCAKRRIVCENKQTIYATDKFFTSAEGSVPDNRGRVLKEWQFQIIS